MHGITKHPPSCVILSDTKIGSHLLRLTLLCVSSPLTHSFLCTCEKCVYRATWGVIITSDPLIILPRAARHKTNTNLEASNQTIIRSGTNRPSVFPSVCVRVFNVLFLCLSHTAIITNPQAIHMSGMCKFGCAHFYLSLCHYTKSLLLPLPRAQSTMRHYCFKQAHNVLVKQKLVRRKNKLRQREWT